MPNRSVTTDIWEDEWFEELSKDEKLLWFYLITNSATRLSGVYELRFKKAARETGLTPEQIIGCLQKFQQSRKIAYSFDYQELALVNWKRYNMHGGWKAYAAVAKELKHVKDVRLALLMYPYDEGKPLYGTDKVTIEHPLAERVKEERKVLSFDEDITTDWTDTIESSSPLERLLTVWNGCEHLPRWPKTIANARDLGDIRDNLKAYGENDCREAILALDRNWERLERAGETRPTLFDRFMASSVERWVPSQRPDERYDRYASDEEILQQALADKGFD